MNCPNPNCNTKNLPNEAIFCPNYGQILVATPHSYINDWAVDECKKSIEMNPCIAKDVICELLSLSHRASLNDIIHELKNKIK